MRSINAKITIILIIGLLFQVLITGTFYQLALTKKIIYEININGNTRQAMLNNVIKKIEKIGNDIPELQTYLLRYSQSNNVDFKIKDTNGNIICMTTLTNNMSKKIEDKGFVEINDKPTYVVFAYFPTKTENILYSIQGNDTKLLLAFIVAVIAIVTSFIIYWIIGAPLKKLRNAMENIDYGNTEVSVPYEANDEIGLLCRNIEEMGRRLKKSEDNQNQLIQAISHDLKTPLTSILGYVSRLSDGKVTSEEKRIGYYEIIKRKAFDLKNLIDELEDFSNLFKDAKYDMHRLNLNEFFLDMCYELENEVNRRGAEFSFTKDTKEDYSIIIDEGKIRRVFTNVVDNSLKYAGENSKISMGCSVREDFVIFEICDNGIGVPKGEFDNIFTRFYRVDTSRSREMGGTGLGLAICRDIVEAHGGKIYAKPGAAGGLCIAFSIPITMNMLK